MKKIYIKKVIKNRRFKLEDFFGRFKMSLLNLSFVIYCIIYKMLALLKNTLNYLKDSILECFFI